MWGGRAGLLPEVMPLVRQYQSGRMETANIDQWFLRDGVWPLIRDRSLIHDRIFRTLAAQPWPEPDPPGTLHVGQNEAAVDPVGQVSKLGEWFDRSAWLQSAASVAPAPVSTPQLDSPDPLPTDVNDALDRQSPPPANMICGLWINLDRATTRRQELEQQLQVAGLAGEYQRVEGVEGSQVAPNIARPGVIGCWLSHLRALERGRASGKVVHILEDDTLLGHRAQELFHSLASSPTVRKYDLVFTDVLLDYFTTQHYFKAFTEQAGQVSPGEIPSFVHAIDLREILFACTNSYFISPDRIGTVLDLLTQTYQQLDPHNPEPIDMAMRRLVRTGKLSAAVTCPFLTSCQLDALADSTIENNADTDLNRTRWLHSIHRQAFFYGADDRALLTQLESQFPTQLSSDKSRLLSLLYEQFLIQSQKSF
jgi:GR25 family glycosyltransferase involved in LPS biosynthesis